MKGDTKMVRSRYFNVGEVFVTKSINELVKSDMPFNKAINNALTKFINKDQGILCDEDKALNDEALKHPDDLYILAAYETPKGKVYIITNRKSEEPGDNVTTICFPDER